MTDNDGAAVRDLLERRRGLSERHLNERPAGQHDGRRDRQHNKTEPAHREPPPPSTIASMNSHGPYNDGLPATSPDAASALPPLPPPPESMFRPARTIPLESWPDLFRPSTSSR